MASRYRELMAQRRQEQGRGGRTLESNRGGTGGSRYRQILTGGQQGTPAVFDNPFVSGALSGARHLASALEPLQLPKDVFDAFVASSLDPETSFQDRISRLNWGAYAPGGATPTRATTGREVAELMGIRDKRAQGVFSLAYDIGADPLLLGAYVGGAGRVARLAGATDMANDLARWGRAADRALSPLGVYDRLPQPVRVAMEERVAGAARAVASTRVPWNRGDDARTLGDLVISRRPALQLQLGEGGEQLADVQSLARQAGQDVEIRALDILAEGMQTMYGQDTRTFWQKAFTALTRHGQAAQRMPAFSPGTRDTAMRRAYEYTKSNGFLANDLVPTRSPEMLELRAIQGAIPQGRRDQATANFITVVEDVKATAARNGDDPEQVEVAFREFVGAISEADALLGYHSSGMDQVKERFFQAFASQWSRRGGSQPGTGVQQATALWEDALSRGLNGRWDEVEGMASFISDGQGGYKTVKQVLDDSGLFRALDVGAYLNGLREGHMRRAFGLFMDNDTYNRFLGSIEKGKLMPSTIIDETQVVDILKQSRPREGQLIEEYINSLKPLLGTEQGTLINKYGLMDHLVANGVKPRDARAALEEMVGIMNPKLVERRGEVASMAAERYDVHPHRRATIGRSFFRAREDLETEVLERLGEIAHPLVSLMESSKGARVKVAWSQMMEDSYSLAQQHRWMSDTPLTDPVTKLRFEKIQDAPEVWGGFAGKYVHPMLKKELLTAMRARGSNEQIMQRMRSLITGGYLASPNVIAANIAGGVYTAAMAGVSPTRMVTEMVRTFPEFMKSSRDPNYRFADLEELKQFIAINDISLIEQNFGRNLKSADTIARGIGREGFNNQFDKAMSLIENQLRGPLGQRWAGLDGFQFVENWMKVSIYRAQKAELAELGLQAGGDIMARAAESARIGVFDYTEIPDAFRTLRDYGLLLFPGFTYFLGARTVSAAMKNPGRLAAADRIADGINSSLLDEEERLAVYASLPEWLQDEHGVVAWKRKDKAGDEVYSVIPFAQLVPTATFYGTPWGESLMSAGIWKPFQELMSAWITGTGEAPFSAQYGQRVFERGMGLPTQAVQSGGFLVNNLMPGLARKITSYSPGNGFDGLVPQLLERAFDFTGEAGEAMYTMTELEKRKPSRSLWDTAISSFIRSPQAIATTGPLANVRSEFVGARRELDRETAAWKQRLQRAAARGDQAGVQRAQARIRRMTEEFMLKWSDYLQAVNNVQ